ncbi:MAG TPA: cation:proton antiporter, partial [Candidatus Saccharimonadales bacterium]|nr:cation:proton antiporter [Candidatus Saccharimonadales bacterium]
MENVSIFTQLSLVIVLAAVVSLIMRILKQPLIMGYILTGIIVGPAVLHLVDDAQTFDAFAQIGIALLLFIVGLGLNASVIKSLGSVASSTALMILLTVGSLGAVVGKLFGFSDAAAIIVGLSLFFSSTIIILKALSDKKETHRLYGQIAIGVILLDDVVATLALVAVAALGSGGNLSEPELLGLVGKALALGLGLYLISRYVLPWLAKQFAAAQELLYLFTIAWGFGVASVFYLAGFSMEVGALFAGVSMASLPYATEMSSRLKPLRDFFVILFFIILGSGFSFDGIAANLGPALVLSAVVM